MDYSNYKKIKITNNKLDFWLKKNKNVLLIGNHGVGKTSIVMDGFERNGLVLNESYKIFSGGTLDPWTDFIGIPKKVTNEDGEDHLEYIRPEYMNDKLEAIFMDEYNRTNPKVRNALMELIQFKSINGRKFPNLKVVWAACNPPSDDDFNYDVEEVDEAQGDRFQIIVQLPYSPSKPYFTKHYGSDIADQAIDWWQRQPEKAQNAVSPRRLDYALEYFQEGGDISEILPILANVDALKTALHQEPIVAQFVSAFSDKDTNKIKEIINDENNFDALKATITQQDKYYHVLSSHLKEERVSLLLTENDKFFEWSIKNAQIHMRLRNIMKSLYDSELDVITIGSSTVPTPYSKNSGKMDELKILFDNERGENVKFLVPKASAPRVVAFSEFSTTGESSLRSKLDAHVNLTTTKGDTMINPTFLKNYWLKVSGYLFDPSLLQPSTNFKFLNYANFLAKSGKWSPQTSGFAQLFEYVNDIIAHQIKKDLFTEDTYYNILGDYVDIVRYSKGFIIEEKTNLEIGDVAINSPILVTDNKNYSKGEVKYG